MAESRWLKSGHNEALRGRSEQALGADSPLSSLYLELRGRAARAQRSMAMTNMKKNPLTSTIIVFAIGDAYTLLEAVTRSSVSVFTVVAWLQGIVLFGLYLRKSRYAGRYLFYSVIPFFPVYFGLKLLGFNPPAPSSSVYFIAFLVYVAGIILLWRQKRDYDHYIRAETISPSTFA